MQEKELKYRRESLGKWKLDLIHKLLDVLDLPRGQGEKVGRGGPLAWELHAPGEKERGEGGQQSTVW